jgi:hypothetical protein
MPRCSRPAQMPSWRRRQRVLASRSARRRCVTVSGAISLRPKSDQRCCPHRRALVVGADLLPEPLPMAWQFAAVCGLRRGGVKTRNAPVSGAFAKSYVVGGAGIEPATSAL